MRVDVFVEGKFEAVYWFFGKLKEKFRFYSHERKENKLKFLHTAKKKKGFFVFNKTLSFKTFSVVFFFRQFPGIYEAR